MAKGVVITLCTDRRTMGGCSARALVISLLTSTSEKLICRAVSSTQGGGQGASSFPRSRAGRDDLTRRVRAGLACGSEPHSSAEWEDEFARLHHRAAAVEQTGPASTEAFDDQPTGLVRLMAFSDGQKLGITSSSVGCVRWLRALEAEV